MHQRIEALLSEHRVISVSAHPQLGSSLRRLKGNGLVDNPLPGVFTACGDRSATTWLRAVSAWAGPAGVIHGRSAASLWLPDLSGPLAMVAHPTLKSRPNVIVSRHLVPTEFVRVSSGVRFAIPAYAAAELAGLDDGRALCEALRLRLADAATVAAAADAFAGSPGNAKRRHAVAACADNPWSYAELRLHRILRSAGITGWVANRPITITGTLIFPDVRFLARLLVLEFDGRSTHGSTQQFLADRERWNLLESAGYHVLRFGWEHLDQRGYVVTTVRAALRAAPPLS